MSQIYVGTYAKYNKGNLFGDWLDLTAYCDREEFDAACKALHADEADPELMFQDWADIPEGMVSESFLSDDVWEWLALDEDDKELLVVYREDVNQTGTIDQASEAYRGKFASEEEWAEDHWDQSGLLTSIHPELRSYIDYAAYASDAQRSSNMTFVRYEGATWAFRNNV